MKTLFFMETSIPPKPGSCSCHSKNVIGQKERHASQIVLCKNGWRSSTLCLLTTVTTSSRTAFMRGCLESQRTSTGSQLISTPGKYILTVFRSTNCWLTMEYWSQVSITKPIQFTSLRYLLLTTFKKTCSMDWWFKWVLTSPSPKGMSTHFLTGWMI